MRSGVLRGTVAVVVLAVVAVAGVAALLTWTVEDRVSETCVVALDDGTRRALDADQADNAALITAVTVRRGLPARAATIALATAVQESKLRNIDYGDRDSVGLFQQRPSQGWGTPEQIMDPVYSAGKFYDHLVEIPGYSRLPLTVAAQRVQRSGFPDAYAKHESRAALLTAALTGRQAASLTCVPGRGESVTAGDPVRVREKLIREFGEDVLPESARVGGGVGRSAPDPVLSVPVRTPARGTGADADRRGWEVAHWAVAHSSELGIERVSYGDRVWEATRAREGWRASGESHRSEVVIVTAR